VLASDLSVYSEARKRVAVSIKEITTDHAVFLIEPSVVSLLCRYHQELRKRCALFKLVPETKVGKHRYVPRIAVCMLFATVAALR